MTIILFNMLLIFDNYTFLLRSIFECLFEILFCDRTNRVFLFLDTGLMANIRIRIYNKILNKSYFTLSEMGASQMQHFFL